MSSELPQRVLSPREQAEIARRHPEDGGWEAPVEGSAAIYRAKRSAWRSASKGKGRYDLLVRSAIHRLALRMEQGADKYGERTWERNNTPEGRASCIESMLRHAFQVSAGMTDEDHLAAVMANAQMLIHFEETGLAPHGDVGPRVGG